MKFHYTYISTDNKLFYIGVRSCACDIEEDPYMGSYKDKTFKPVSKRILGIHENREDAVLAEIYWQRLFKVVENPLFVNQAYQTSIWFDFRPDNAGENHGYYEKTKYLFIHKDGTELILTPFEFRKKFNASPSSIHDIKAGNRRAWKGWRATCLV